MKKSNVKTVIMLVAMIMSSSILFAQAGTGNGAQNGQCNGLGPFKNIPNLTADQESKIKEFKTAHMKTALPIKNEIAEKEAKLNTLSSSEKADMTQINSLIDEISQLKAKLMKDRENMVQNVRKILTEEQRLYFDMNHSKVCGGKKNCYGQGNANCNGQGRSNCNGQGNANCNGQGKGGKNNK